MDGKAMMKKTSIIIPFYNEGLRLKGALDSALAQKGVPIEWILVDDGSTDGSGDLALARSRGRPEVLCIRQENAGLGAARNRALDEAQGEYILFLDGDDELVEGAVEKLVKTLERTQAGMAASRFHLLGVGNQPLSTGGFRLDSSLISGEEAARALFDYRLTNTVWAKLYRRDKIQGIRFPPNLWFEDLPFVLKALLQAKSLTLVEDPLWRIRARPQSISRRRLEARRIKDSQQIFRINQDWALSQGLGGSFMKTLVDYQWDQLLDSLIFLAQDWNELENPRDLAKEVQRCLVEMESHGWSLNPLLGEGKRKDRSILWACKRGLWPLAMAMILLGKRSRYRAIRRIRQHGSGGSLYMQ